MPESSVTTTESLVAEDRNGLLQQNRPIGDICNAARASLFDHLIGAQQQASGQFDAERPGRGQIDDQRKFGRLLDRQFACVGTLENAIDVDGRLPELILPISSVINQPTVPGESFGRIDGRQAIACYQLEDEAMLGREKWVWRKDQTAVWPLREARDQRLEVAGRVDGSYNRFDRERRRRGLDGGYEQLGLR